MHERFRYKTKEGLLKKAKDLDLNLPFSDDISPLLDTASFDGFSVPNRLVVQPMEGYDSEPDGSPSDLTKRRYLRYAAGRSGIIWYEAVSVSHDGRSNPRQLWINRKNFDSFGSLNEEVRKSATYSGTVPFLVIQLTHSGRYSKPEGKSKPQVAAVNNILDRTEPYILTDDDLKRIQDNFVSAARLAAYSGFDAIDIKACHGYLIIDTPLPGVKVPDEHPLSGVLNMINGTSVFQKRFPEIHFVGSAYSYLRQYAPNVGAAVIKNGDASFIGFGRSSFAYPSMPLDLIRMGKADPAKVCIACSGCTRLIKSLHPGGCVIRDREIYATELKKLIADEK